MTEQRFQETGFRMTYAEFSACDCTKCSRENCPHREAYRRFPFIDGGLALCPNLRGFDSQR